MKKLAAALAFLLLLAGCGGNEPENGDAGDSVPSGDEMFAAAGGADMEACRPNLTLMTLKDLAARCGESLTWADLAPYYSEDAGSELYTLRYPLDWDYSLLAGGRMETDPVYIHLVSEHDAGSYIDVRSENIDDFTDSTPRTAGFSYAEVCEAYGENDPGVKRDGFANTEPAALETAGDVLERAKGECTVEYDAADIAYDSVEGIWRVVFHKEGTAGGDQAVYMDAYGVTILAVYGE